MLKRTKGRFLLTLLVITGLAGTLKNSTITQQERKSLVTNLKDTRNDFFGSTKGLSEAQLHFKPAPDRWSVRDCMTHITLAETRLWSMLETTMKEPANPEKRSEIKMSDEDILKLITDRTNKLKAPDPIQPDKGPWQSAAETANQFKTIRADHIKYAKSTTEDLRNHFVQMPFGWIDAYQLILFISGHSNRHIQQIEEVKADPAFPKR